MAGFVATSDFSAKRGMCRRDLRKSLVCTWRFPSCGNFRAFLALRSSREICHQWALRALCAMGTEWTKARGGKRGCLKASESREKFLYYTFVDLAHGPRNSTQPPGKAKPLRRGAKISRLLTGYVKPERTDCKHGQRHKDCGAGKAKKFSRALYPLAFRTGGTARGIKQNPLAWAAGSMSKKSNPP